MAKAKKKAAKKLDPAKDFAEPVKKARQARLPEMEDPKIEALESAAEEYAEIRDKRQMLTKSEVELKNSLLSMMKREGKSSYNRDGVNIQVVVEKEKVRVRIKKYQTEE